MMEDCIEHQGRFDRDGYGQVKYQGKTMGAHRAAWIKQHGPIPNGLLVLHGCNNRRCINLNHLRLGTKKDNMEDRRKAGLAGKWPHPVQRQPLRSPLYSGHILTLDEWLAAGGADLICNSHK